MSDSRFQGTPKPDVRRVDPATEDHWLTRPSTVRRLWWLMSVVLALIVLVQFAIPVKGKFALESTFAFGAWFGFFSCVAMVLVARALGWWLKRGEDYYGEADPASDSGPKAEERDHA